MKKTLGLLWIAFLGSPAAMADQVPITSYNFALASAEQSNPPSLDHRYVFFKGESYNGHGSTNSLDSVDSESALGKCIRAQRDILQSTLSKSSAELTELKVVNVTVTVSNNMGNGSYIEYDRPDPNPEVEEPLGKLYVDMNMGPSGKCSTASADDISGAIKKALADEAESRRFRQIILENSIRAVADQFAATQAKALPAQTQQTSDTQKGSLNEVGASIADASNDQQPVRSSKIAGSAP